MSKNHIKMAGKSHFGRFISSLMNLGNLSYTAQRAAGVTALRGCIDIILKLDNYAM